MTKTGKILYWVSTLWLALGMVSTGIVQVLKVKSETDFIIQLGYPGYILTLLGAWKILGSAAVLVPKFPLLKEWAYAGFFFTMTGAVYSHIAADSAMKDLLPAVLLLVLTMASWSLRPAERKIV